MARLCVTGACGTWQSLRRPQLHRLCCSYPRKLRTQCQGAGRLCPRVLRGFLESAFKSKFAPLAQPPHLPAPTPALFLSLLCWGQYSRWHMLGKCSSTEVLCYIIHLYWTGGVAQAAEYRPSSREAKVQIQYCPPPQKKKKSTVHSSWLHHSSRGGSAWWSSRSRHGSQEAKREKGRGPQYPLQGHTPSEPTSSLQASPPNGPTTSQYHPTLETKPLAMGLCGDSPHPNYSRCHHPNPPQLWVI
jgi:hypothetical protein